MDVSPADHRWVGRTHGVSGFHNQTLVVLAVG